METEIVVLLKELLSDYADQGTEVTNVSVDYDHQSAEVIFDYEGKTFVIRSADIREGV